MASELARAILLNAEIVALSIGPNMTMCCDWRRSPNCSGYGIWESGSTGIAPMCDDCKLDYVFQNAQPAADYWRELPHGPNIRRMVELRAMLRKLNGP